MARDLIYYYDKETKTQYTLGEIQTNFNMNFVIDGTKDSAKVIVHSFNGEALLPFTIVQHPNTNSWWIVAADKVERHTNESGYYYIHTLKLEGAIELLNARDLTDNGNYQNRYTIRSLVAKLLKLSNFEFNDNYSLNTTDIDLDQNIDYIKTYENYTLLSALRELFDGYNCAIKLSFTTITNGHHITKLREAYFQIISKAGVNNGGTPIDSEEVFSLVKEIKDISKESYGTTAMSNADNVVSTKAKKYPTVGAVRLSSKQATVDRTNAILRLPSPIFKVNYFKLHMPVRVAITYSGGAIGTSGTFVFIYENVFDEDYVNRRFNEWIEGMRTYFFRVSQSFVDEIESSKAKILAPILLAGSVTLFSGMSYNPNDYRWVAPKDNPDYYQVNIGVAKESYNGQLVMVSNEERESAKYPFACISYDRGNDYVEHFDFLAVKGTTFNPTRIKGYEYTDLRNSNYNNRAGYFELGDSIGGPHIVVALDDTLPNLTVDNTFYSLEYIPMTDLKIKLDNSGFGNDIHVYNQNGKLNDGVALSKLMNSYLKEIESDTITRYGEFYSIDDVPYAGQIVNYENKPYVINNVSLNFYQNEDFEYYIVGEFTMSKYMATKSINVSPNSNIRDYGIPQKYNVKRKQVYRDFFELSYTKDTKATFDYFMPLNKVLNLSNYYTELVEHIAVIKLTYDEPYGGDNNGTGESDTWYYQLDTTTYVFKKSIIEVVDFKDNNIIGYGSQNVFSGFDITKILFQDLTEIVNTPISYVNSNGEVKDIEIAFCTNEQLTSIYQNYLNQKEEELQRTINETICNASVFVPEEIYEGSALETSPLYEGSIIETGTGAWLPDRIDITDYLNGYEGSASDLSLGSIVAYGPTDTGVVGTDFDYSFTKIGNRYYIELTSLTVTGSTCNVVVVNNIYKTGYEGAKDNCDFIISEEDYNKDAIEVPFFEYMAQVDDSDDVLIGSNVLDQKDSDTTFLYSFHLVPKNTINENNVYGLELDDPVYYDDNTNLQHAYIENSTRMYYHTSGTFGNSNYVEYVSFAMYESEDYNFDNGEINTGNVINVDDIPNWQNYDIVIMRHSFNSRTTKYTKNGVQYVKSNKELMFILRNLDSVTPYHGSITAIINHYKLK